MDVKKFFGDEPAAEGTKMSDALVNRLMIQVQEYSVEGPNGEDVSPETVLKKVEENKGAPGKLEDVYKMTHIFFVKQLENEHDPNKATNLMDYGKGDAWKTFFAKEGKKK